MKIALVGSSGYAACYIHIFQNEKLEDTELCAVIDPFADKSPCYPWIQAQGIPVYSTLEEFYEKGNTAELVIVSSPIQFHKSQCETAMGNGAVVLSEKPLCATTADALELEKFQEKTGKALGVGFQWSFSKTMTGLKRDILDGKLGKPVLLKTMASMKRDDSYYDNSTWKGRIKDAKGNMIMDSIIMNASSHYLHNMLFLLGDAMDTAAEPESIECSLYKARDIQSFDTCFLEGDFANGCKILYCASHAAERSEDPSFTYIFENAVVTYDGGEKNSVKAVFSDGSVKDYGKPQTSAELNRKFFEMIKVAKGEEAPVCSVKTILPHLSICNRITLELPVTSFEKSSVVKEEKGLHVKGLLDAMKTFFEKGENPYAQGMSWASPSVKLTLEG